jgi:hypothetical protein
MPSGLHPRFETVSQVVPASATAAAADIILTIAPFAGALISAKYVPDTAITGANTDTRKVSVINRAAGAGTTEMAALTFVSGTNGTAFAPSSLTLAATAADRNFTAGQVIAFRSAAVGNGLADPGGTIFIEIARD